MPSRLLGIDVGTGGTRAVLIDGEGTVVASRTAEHVPFASPETGWAEQDPHDWWRATCEAIKQVMAGSGTTPTRLPPLVSPARCTVPFFSTPPVKSCVRP